MDQKEPPTGPAKETPKERTERLLAQAKEQFKQHEQRSRASQGYNQFPLVHKLKMTLPFIALVFGMYSWSLIQTEKKYDDIKRRRLLANKEKNSDDTEIKNVDKPIDEEILTDGFKW